MKRVSWTCEVVYEPPVHITKAKERYDLCRVRRGLRLAMRVDIGFVYLKRSWFYHVSEVLNFFLKEVELVYLQSDSCFG